MSVFGSQVFGQASMESCAIQTSQSEDTILFRMSSSSLPRRQMKNVDRINFPMGRVALEKVWAQTAKQACMATVSSYSGPDC